MSKQSQFRLVNRRDLYAVLVPAGQHDVVFEFRPISFVIGATITLTSLGGLIGISYASRSPHE